MFIGTAVLGVWLAFSGFGAVLGRATAAALHRSERRSEWAAIGGAVGCAWGLLAMVAAIASQ